MVSFAVAWFFRLVDRDVASTLPMGSHWLWHTFGAIATAMMIEFFYKLEGEKQQEPRMNTDNADQNRGDRKRSDGITG